MPGAPNIGNIVPSCVVVLFFFFPTTFASLRPIPLSETRLRLAGATERLLPRYASAGGAWCEKGTWH